MNDIVHSSDITRLNDRVGVLEQNQRKIDEKYDHIISAITEVQLSVNTLHAHDRNDTERRKGQSKDIIALKDETKDIQITLAKLAPLVKIAAFLSATIVTGAVLAGFSYLFKSMGAGG